MFVFDALMESIMCGDNSIAAPAKSAKLRLEELAKVNPATKLSGYESQFRVIEYSNRTVRCLSVLSIELETTSSQSQRVRLPVHQC